jgi:hypothetical protein
MAGQTGFEDAFYHCRAPQIGSQRSCARKAGARSGIASQIRCPWTYCLTVDDDRGHPTGVLDESGIGLARRGRCSPASNRNEPLNRRTCSQSRGLTYSQPSRRAIRMASRRLPVARALVRPPRRQRRRPDQESGTTNEPRYSPEILYRLILLSARWWHCSYRLRAQPSWVSASAV